MKKVSVEHIEKDFVLCENLKTSEKIYLEKNSVPKNVKEGDVLNLYDGKIEIDKNETLKRKEQLFKLQSEIFKKSQEEKYEL